MSEPKYGEPWVSRDNWVGTGTDAGGPGFWTHFKVTSQVGEPTRSTAARIANCVNLLAQVPDDAPAFHARKSDEVQLALAVLQGDYGAAAALADEIISKHIVPPTVRAPGSFGYFKTLGECLKYLDYPDSWTPEFRGIQSSTIQHPVLRWVCGMVSRRLYQYKMAGYPRIDMYINFSGTAGRAVLGSEEVRTYLAQAPSWDELIPRNMRFQLYGVSVTVPGIDVPGMPDMVLGILDRGNIPAHALVVEDAFQ